MVGAGVVGAACAAELSARGLRVAVLERAVVGGGATAAGMGHLVAMDDGEPQLALTLHGRDAWRTRLQAPAAAARCGYLPCGTIWVAADPAEMDEAERKGAAYRAAGVECRLLSAAELARAEPRLRDGLHGGLLVPDDGVVYGPAAAAFLLDEALRLGAVLIRGRAVGVLDGAVELETGQHVQAEAVVLATGAWARELAPEVPVTPRKGHLAITDRVPAMITHQVVELGYVRSTHAASGNSVAFNVQPRPTGQILVGSSRQPETATTEVDPPVLARMLDRAIAFLPGLAELPCIRTWTGLRAATADGLPLVGPHPGRHGVWLATGHEGLGITTALATADLLAGMWTGSAAAIASAPYLPARLMPPVTLRAGTPGDAVPAAGSA